MGELSLPLAVTKVFADENRLPLANVQITEGQFAAYQTPLGDVLFDPVDRFQSQDTIYLADGAKAAFGCAVESSKRGNAWTPTTTTPDLIKLHVPGQDGLVKLRRFEREGRIEIYVPLPGAELETHCRADKHNVIIATRVTEPAAVIAAYKGALIYGYEDSYDLTHVQQLTDGAFLFVSKARWSKNPAPLRVTYLDNQGRRHDVRYERIPRPLTTAIKTAFGTFEIHDDLLTDADVAPVATLMRSAGVLAVSPAALKTKQDLLEALRLDLAPRRKA